jgi:hypothetical protein
MFDLQATIHEALEFAPPEHLELALAALLEARFVIVPKAGSIRYAPPVNLRFPNFANTAPSSSRTCGRGFWRGRRGSRPFAGKK